MTGEDAPCGAARYISTDNQRCRHSAEKYRRKQSINFIKCHFTAFPDSMTTLGQRWETIGPLADSWRWVHNVGPTLGQH